VRKYFLNIKLIHLIHFSTKIILAVVSLGIVLKAVKTETSHAVNETSDTEAKNLTEKLKSLFNFLRHVQNSP
jgi:hypothetical protein